MLLQRGRGDFGGRVDADGQHWSVELVKEAQADLVVGIDDGETFRRELIENPLLGLPIVALSPVEIQVIVADVRNAGDVELHAGGTRKRQGMARYFHHAVRAAIGQHSSQRRSRHSPVAWSNWLSPRQRRRNNRGCPTRPR